MKTLLLGLASASLILPLAANAASVDVAAPVAAPTIDTQVTVPSPGPAGAAVTAPGTEASGFGQIDANTDGKVTRVEAKGNSMLMKRFSTIDRNGDGHLNAAEYASFEAEAGAKTKSPAPAAEPAATDKPAAK